VVQPGISNGGVGRDLEGLPGIWVRNPQPPEAREFKGEAARFGRFL